ncbi:MULTISPECIES: hypothetical protein [unclassified Paraburkholderia]|uniref:hypothetical protein n=1 Tax=unclassified Paraburkholderia TaxID=2615204 RepID=UPI002AB1BC34|nr:MULTISPECIES: hypothetical protein [unclassified Paraburkholderia]
MPAKTSSGTTVGTLVYPVTHYRVNGVLMVWCVVFNTKTKVVCPLRQRGWCIHADSAITDPPQRATVDPGDAPVTRLPFLQRVANAVVNDPANQRSGALGSGTVTFTRSFIS